MKQLTVTLLLALAFLCRVSAVRAQGNLNPTAAPAPTMKSLDQVASTGIAINAVNTPGDSNSVYNITQSGNYFLTSNVNVPASKVGIDVQVSGVTVDLNGFQVIGPGNAGSIGTGILSLGGNNCTIKNGLITNFPVTNSAGISCHTNGALIANVAVTNCSGGIEVFSNGEGAVLRDCTASSCGVYGFYVVGAGSVLTNCAANRGTVQYGFQVGNSVTLSNCSAYANTSTRASSAGILAGTGCTLIGCTATANTNSTTSNNAGVGIVVGNDSTVQNCTVQGNSGDGLQTGAHCTIGGSTANGNGSGTIGSGINAAADASVSGCTAQGNKASGLQLLQHCLVLGCSASGNASGISVGDSSVISRCTTSGNGSYGITTGNTCSIADSSTSSNTTSGLIAGGACVVRDCTAVGNTIHGITMTSATSVRDCVVENNGQAGIQTSGFGNRIEGNETRDQHGSSGSGIKIDTANGVNVVIRNTAGNNTTNYDIASGNGVGPIISVSGGAVGAATNSPFANTQD